MKKHIVWKVVRVIGEKWYSAITPTHYKIGSKWVLEYRPGVKQDRWCLAFLTEECAARFRMDHYSVDAVVNLEIKKAVTDRIIKIDYLPSVNSKQRLFKSLKEYKKFTVKDVINAPAGTLFCKGLKICK